VARRALATEAQADTLIYAAWVTHHGAFWDSEANLDWIAASLDLLRGFAASGGRRVVFVGSCAEYDWARATRTPWRETRATRPASLYGAAKLATWIAGSALAAQAGLSPACARLFVPIGQHEAPGR
jgi:nucleoside-diphosphate-sugar epimerase